MKLIAALFLAIAAAAQQVPKSACDFDGFDINSQLAEVKFTTTAYYGCGTGKCLPMTLKPDNPVVVNRAEGSWTCGYLIARDGSAQGWIPAKSIKPVVFDAKPLLADWVSAWHQGDNGIILIHDTRVQDRLGLQGRNEWRGSRGNTHSGEFMAVVKPNQDRLHIEDGPCKIDLALRGKYLLANDNNMCGGANVRFWGVWRRSPPTGLRPRKRS